MRSYILHRFGRINDLRFASLSAEAERTYTRLYELAGMLDAEGLFVDGGRVLSTDEIAYRIRLDTKPVMRAITELQKARLIHVNGKGPQILDWKREQIDLNKKREQDRERQAKHRGVTRDTTVTGRDANLSQSVTGIERETKTQTKTLLSLLSGEHQKFLEAHPEWVTEAIAIAKASDKRDPKYTAGILRNWITEGRKKKGVTRATSNATKGNAKPATTNEPAYTDRDRAAAARALARRKASV